MLSTNEEYSGILLKSKSAGEALHSLFYIAKAHSKSWSLGKLSRLTGIKSRGFLSDLMAEKKKLKPEHVPALSKALGLEPAQEKVFLALSALDFVQESEKAEKSQELIAARKTLKIKKASSASKLKNLLLTLEVYSLVNMHKTGRTYQQIRDYFKKEPLESLRLTLADLISTKLLHQKDGVFLSTGESFLFSESDDNCSHLEFLKVSMTKILDEVEFWFERNDQAHIESSLITVNSKKYSEQLKAIKDQLLDMQRDLDADDPDMILRFNVQIVPANQNRVPSIRKS